MLIVVELFWNFVFTSMNGNTISSEIVNMSSNY